MWLGHVAIHRVAVSTGYVNRGTAIKTELLVRSANVSTKMLWSPRSRVRALHKGQA